MSLIEDILKDREAGTPGDKWEWTTGYDAEDEDNYAMGNGWIDTADGEPVLSYAGCGTHDTKISPADQSRIARVPEMESALLAAEELAKAADDLCERYLEIATGPEDISRSDVDADYVSTLRKVAAYRAATGAA